MMDQRKRSRLTLLALAALFAAPVVAAVFLHATGWEPSKTRNHGTLLQPPLDLRELPPLRADGTRYEWEPAQRRWRLAVVAPAECADACIALIDSLDKVWQLQGRRADRLDVLWFGEVPVHAIAFRRFVPMRYDSSLVSQLPDKQSNERGEPPLYLIDPSGFLAMRYAPGADVAGVREDIARLLK